MAHIEVKIFEGEQEVHSELIYGPVTAGQAMAGLSAIKEEWVGKLTARKNNISLMGDHQLYPGETYHLHLRQQAGTCCGRDASVTSTTSWQFSFFALMLCQSSSCGCTAALLWLHSLVSSSNGLVHFLSVRFWYTCLAVLCLWLQFVWRSLGFSGLESFFALLQCFQASLVSPSTSSSCGLWSCG